MAVGVAFFPFIGSTLSQGPLGPLKATYIGVSISKSAFRIEPKWEDNFDNGNDEWTLIDTIYGIYSRHSRDTAMIKYWTKGPEVNKLELYSIPANFSRPPRVEMDWPIVSIM